MSQFKFLQPKTLGALGEAMVEFHYWWGLGSAYRLINDSTISLKGGGTTQIDHILISRYGVFVIETKNYKGVIKGTKDDQKWKQVLGSKTYEFYNPIKQNEAHVNVVKGILGGICPREHVHNVVVFTTRSKHERGWFGFGAKLPENVCFGYAWVKYVKKYKKKVLTNEQVDEIKAKIESRVLSKNLITNTKHVLNVKFRRFK